MDYPIIEELRKHELTVPEIVRIAITPREYSHQRLLGQDFKGYKDYQLIVFLTPIEAQALEDDKQLRRYYQVRRNHANSRYIEYRRRIV